MSDTWKAAIIEGAMVLVGVLLALFLDSWREDVEFQTRVDVTEAKIVEEIRGNRDRIVEYKADFRRRAVQLAEWGEALDPEIGILRQLDGFPGIPSTFINRSAWSMANNSQITEHLDYAFYDAAFELYAAGAVSESRLGIALDLFFDVQGFDARHTQNLLDVMKLYFQDIISNLETAEYEHNRFLKEFGGTPPS